MAMPHLLRRFRRKTSAIAKFHLRNAKTFSDLQKKQRKKAEKVRPNICVCNSRKLE